MRQLAVRACRGERPRLRAGACFLASSSGSGSSGFDALSTTFSATSMTRLPPDLATLLSRSNACRGGSRCRSASTPMACSTRTRAASACSSCATVTASRAASPSSSLLTGSLTGSDLEERASPAGGGAGNPRSAASRSASTIALVRSAACSSPTCQPCSDRRTTIPFAAASPLSPGVVSPLTVSPVPRLAPRPFGKNLLSRTTRVSAVLTGFHPAMAASCALTCAAEGLVSALPSGKTTVGTVWLPPFTDITNSAAASSRSMSTSAISIPARASWLLRFRQKPHQVVVYIVSWPDTRRLLEVGGKLLVVVTPAGPVAFPEVLRAARMRHDEAREGGWGGGWAVTDAVLDTSETLLAGLDPEQREVALAPRGAVCVLAGAGTGKTRAITYRIAYAAAAGTVNPAHVLALTFTVRAAGELRGRLRQLSAGGPGSGGPGSGGAASGGLGTGLGTGLVRASTFHAAALRQLNYFWPRVIGGRPPQLIDSKASLVREAAKRARVRLHGGAGGALADAAAEIEWAKVTQVRPDGYAAAAAAAGRSPAAGADNLAAVYAAYEELRRERHLIDFESVLELTAAILIDNRAAADQVRDTFRHFVVDEDQDVNPLQKLLLDAWLGDRDDLCVVGDPHQVIYSFTGATPSYLTGFTAEFPGATVIRLVRDYRSTPQVVAVANQLRGGYGGAGSPPVS